MTRKRIERRIVTRVSATSAARDEPTRPDRTEDDAPASADPPRPDRDPAAEEEGHQLRRARRPDELIVEEPLSIELDGVRIATTMRTPGHDFELAVGLCHTDGLLAGAPVHGVRYCATGSAVETEFNVVSVETGGAAPPPTPRLSPTSSSCGWCGSEHLDDLSARWEPLPDAPPFDLRVLGDMPRRVRATQELFERTGAVHGAAAFDRAGDVRLVREDVGRHNAVDKVVGALRLADDLPATGLGLFVSGRASVEMVQKAWSAGFSALVAVSAPTSLAVDAARRAGLVLIGFVRDGSCNVYAPERWPDHGGHRPGAAGRGDSRED